MDKNMNTEELIELAQAAVYGMSLNEYIGALALLVTSMMTDEEQVRGLAKGYRAAMTRYYKEYLIFLYALTELAKSVGLDEKALLEVDVAKDYFNVELSDSKISNEDAFQISQAMINEDITYDELNALGLIDKFNDLVKTYQDAIHRDLLRAEREKELRH